MEIERQVERERYRIALENITDVMFEYDIRQDALVKYERRDYMKRSVREGTEPQCMCGKNHLRGFEIYDKIKA